MVAAQSGRGRTRPDRHVIVVGAGPAGMAAALEAEHAGLAVTLIDEDRRLGGQYYRGSDGVSAFGAPPWFTPGSRLAVRLETAVIDASAATQLTLFHPDEGVRYAGGDGLILATGATDRPVPLPGWTLPGVLTAGGALTLAKSHHVAPGRRVLLSGSGPFLLPVATAMLAAGSSVTVLEATPFLASARGAMALLRDGSTMLQAGSYISMMARGGCRIQYGRGITAVGGANRVEWAETSALDADWRPIPGTSRRLEADAVVLGYGFVPRVDLAGLIGCDLSLDERSMTQHVAIDGDGRTSIAGVYAAGEATGVGGSRIAQLEGRIAGLTAALDLGVLPRTSYVRRIARVRQRIAAPARTAKWIADAYRLRPGLRERATPETIVCRCEEVTRAAIDTVALAVTVGAATTRGIKSATRAGMGLCQGRMCGPTLMGGVASRGEHKSPVQTATAPMWTPRPPLRAVPFSAMAALADGPASLEIDARAATR